MANETKKINYPANEINSRLAQVEANKNAITDLDHEVSEVYAEIELVGVGTDQSVYDEWKVGDIMYNTTDKKLKKCTDVATDGTPTLTDFAFAVKTYYTNGNNVYEYNGTELVKTSKTLATKVNDLGLEVVDLSAEVEPLLKTIPASNNRVNPTTFGSGFLNIKTGLPDQQTSYFNTDFIEVTPNSVYICDKTIFWVAYAKDKSYINCLNGGNRIGENTKFNIGNASFIRFSDKWSKITNVPSNLHFGLANTDIQDDYREEYRKVVVMKENLDDTIVLTKMHYLYVSNSYDKNTPGWGVTHFKTIYDANESITDNSKDNQYTIVVAQGEYTDLQERFAGAYSGVYEGVICKDYVFYESEDIRHPELCIIEWDGAVGFSGEIKQEMIFDKAPFHIVKPNGKSLKTHIKGFTFKCKNLRYCIHPETESNYAFGYDYAISNCIFDWDGRPDSPSSTKSDPAIGCGTNVCGKGLIEHCIWKKNMRGDDYVGGIQAHDGKASTEFPLHYGFELTIKNCNLNGNKIHVRTTRPISDYDTLNTISIINCEGVAAFKNTLLTGATEKAWKSNIVMTDIPE